MLVSTDILLEHLILGMIQAHCTDNCIHTIAPEKVSFASENAVATKALKPDTFQDFTLKEKTVLSHNTAMYFQPLLT